MPVYDDLVYQYRRQYDGPIDIDTTTADMSTLWTYLSFPSNAYSGQIVWVEDEELSVQLIDPSEQDAEAIDTFTLLGDVTEDAVPKVMAPVMAQEALFEPALRQVDTRVVAFSEGAESAGWRVESLWKCTASGPPPEIELVGVPTVTRLGADPEFEDLKVEAALHGQALPSIRMHGLPGQTVMWKAKANTVSISI